MQPYSPLPVIHCAVSTLMLLPSHLFPSTCGSILQVSCCCRTPPCASTLLPAVLLASFSSSFAPCFCLVFASYFLCLHSSAPTLLPAVILASLCFSLASLPWPGVRSPAFFAFTLLPPLSSLQSYLPPSASAWLPCLGLVSAVLLSLPSVFCLHSPPCSLTCLSPLQLGSFALA